LSSRKTTRSFQVRDLETWEKFLELCRKEGTSGSEKLEELVSSYVKDHDPGNPQRDIRIYSRPAAPKVLCQENCVTGVEKYWSSCSLRKRYICRLDSY